MLENIKKRKNGKKIGRPSVPARRKKSNIYTESIHLTLTPEQKQAVLDYSQENEQTSVGYLRTLIKMQMRMRKEQSDGNQSNYG